VAETPAKVAATGLIENLESHTTLEEEVGELEHSGERTVTSYRKVINYGLALALFDIREWLERRLPVATE
jgi:hypothetical protein